MLRIFSVYDKKAQTFFSPFYYLNKALALRAFGEIVADPKSSIYKYPADFQIFLLGDFDEQTGQIQCLDHPEFIAEAADFTQTHAPIPARPELNSKDPSHAIA